MARSVNEPAVRRTSRRHLIFALPAAAVLLPLAGWLFAWHLWLACFGLLALGAAWVLRRPGITTALFFLAIPVVPWSILRYTWRVEHLTERVLRDGPDALGVLDCFAIYGLNLLMAVVGCVLGFPEVAAETALLAVPKGPEYTWSSSRFPRCVPKVGQRIAAFQEQARSGKKRFAPERLAWTYGAPGSSWRGALALTPVTLSGEVVHGRLEIRASVPVDYPERYLLVLGSFAGVKVGVEEGLFHALEERGWLHPYTLIYRDSVALDAPRLEPCEAWVVRLGQMIQP